MSDNYYPFYVGDYLRDTAVLTLVEHGAYHLLLHQYYSNGGNLTSDRHQLYRICRAFTQDEQSAINTICDRYFTENGDGLLRNRKADEVIAKRNTFISQQREKGKKSAEKRWLKDNPGYNHGSTSVVTERQPDCNLPSPSPSIKEKIYSPQSESEDACPHEKIIELYHQILPECSKVKVWSEARRKKLRTRWREDPKRQDLDWWRVYFQNVRLCFWFTTENKKNWYPNLEWLVESSNLINVIEKKYYNERTAV